MNAVIRSLSLLALCRLALAANFTLVKDYSGSTFFDDWDFYGYYDNTTSGAYEPNLSHSSGEETRLTALPLSPGSVNFVNQSDSASLAYVDASNHVIIKVDNTSDVSTYPYLEKRNSVRDFTVQVC